MLANQSRRDGSRRCCFFQKRVGIQHLGKAAGESRCSRQNIKSLRHLWQTHPNERENALLGKAAAGGGRDVAALEKQFPKATTADERTGKRLLVFWSTGHRPFLKVGSWPCTRTRLCCAGSIAKTDSNQQQPASPHDGPDGMCGQTLRSLWSTTKSLPSSMRESTLLLRPCSIESIRRLGDAETHSNHGTTKP